MKLTVTSSPHIRGDFRTSRLMLDVVLALIPALIVGTVVLGFRALLVTLVSAAACVFFEWGYCRVAKVHCKIYDLSAVVTGVLLAFVCPVTIPYWCIIIGDFFAIVVVKQLFGGIGHNIVNPALAARIDDAIGAGWRRDSAELEKLLAHIDDAALLTSLAEIKRANKRRFADWLRGHQGTVIDPDSVFDVQSKRLHEYKRQQLNLLWCVRTLLDIRAGILPERPVTVIFGAKAAPAYTIAKDIIHAILCLSDVIDADPAARRHLRIAMVENYNVSAAEKLIPACDISEQISLASKEASGTGNMKFMLNGAVTLGTLDGANVEIAELVGPENIYTFGLSSEAVINSYARGDYDPAAYLEADPRLKAALDFLVCDEMRTMGDAARLERLHAELQNKDCFMTFPDFADYCATKARMLADLGDEAAWARKALVNIAMAGYFSSDRTIADYDRDIWQVGSAR